MRFHNPSNNAPSSYLAITGRARQSTSLKAQAI